MKTPEDTSWSKIVEPVVKRLQVAAALNCTTTFSSEGSQTLAILITTMANFIDSNLGNVKE